HHEQWPHIDAVQFLAEKRGVVARLPEERGDGAEVALRRDHRDLDPVAGRIDRRDLPRQERGRGWSGSLVGNEDVLLDEDVARRIAFGARGAGYRGAEDN